MGYIKANFGEAKFEDVFKAIFTAYWDQGLDISKPEDLAKTLSPYFAEEKVKAILQAANTPEYKKKITDNTERVVKYGAFGAPWFWVRNSEGSEEPFFGSDRSVETLRAYIEES